MPGSRAARQPRGSIGTPVTPSEVKVSVNVIAARRNAAATSPPLPVARMSTLFGHSSWTRGASGCAASAIVKTGGRGSYPIGN